LAKVEEYLGIKVQELLQSKVRGSKASTMANRLRTSQNRLQPILETMIEDGKLLKRGEFYRLPVVEKEISTEFPVAPCHRLLIKFCELKISGDATKQLCTILESVGKNIAIEAGKIAKTERRATVSAKDVAVAASKMLAKSASGVFQARI
jgi:histone H3/H4